MPNLQHDVENMIVEIKQFDKRILDHNRYLLMFFEESESNKLKKYSDEINELVGDLIEHLKDLRIIINEK